MAVEILVGTDAGVYCVDGSGTPKVTDGLGGRCVRAIRRSNGSVFAGSDQGVYRSNNGGRSWRLSGVEGQIVWDLAAAGDGRTIYAGTQPAALYRSRDGGETWSELEGMQQAPGRERWCVPRSNAGARARTVVLDPADEARYWVGLEVGGVLATSDDGKTWSCTLPGGDPDIHVMVGDPARKGVLFATTGFGRPDGDPQPMSERIAGLFASRDGGQTWRYLWENLQPRYTRPMCVDPRAPHAVTVGCAPSAFSSYRDEGGAKSMLYQTVDGGETWRNLGDADHKPSAANILAVAPGDTAGSAVIGTDTGEVWRVSPEAEWRLLASNLPAIQSLHLLD
jgi:photosystem II stability/assembly factor-like uncharacterized protein